MKRYTYVYDAHRQILAIYHDGQLRGGYFGSVAERKFEQLLTADAEIRLGEFLTARERQERLTHKTP